MHALRPTTLAVDAGEHLAVMGRSGAGKSTLLNVLGLLDTPTEGRYLLAGVDVTMLDDGSRAALRSHLFGFVFQSFHLLSSNTVVENVELGMLYTRLPARLRRRRALEAVEHVGLGSRAGAHPPTLSGGERQRAAIARAIAAGPRVLLCDEPTGNLDSATAAEILDLLGELNAGGLTLVIVTHDPFVAGRAGRVIEVHDGNVREREMGATR